ncbi:MAG: DUF1453 domain-containing protein [Novosphingobium sp.]
MQQGSWLQTLLPFAIIAIVMIRRWRNINRPVPLRTGRLWIMPAVMAALIGFVLYGLPPTQAGWAAFFGGLIAGLVVGWQRARMMVFHVDDASGEVMMRQTPLALLFVIALIFGRRLLVPGREAQAAGSAAPTSLPLFTDALLGFALGMILGMRIEMWRRAKALRAA